MSGAPEQLPEDTPVWLYVGGSQVWEAGTVVSDNGGTNLSIREINGAKRLHEQVPGK